MFPRKRFHLGMIIELDGPQGPHVFDETLFSGLRPGHTAVTLSFSETGHKVA